ncbi:hypothetical protein PSPO01_06917 [Paraphaeosphaeria sporulosa]
MCLPPLSAAARWASYYAGFVPYAAGIECDTTTARAGPASAMGRTVITPESMMCMGIPMPKCEARAHSRRTPAVMPPSPRMSARQQTSPYMQSVAVAGGHASPTDRVIPSFPK